jgi:glucose/arabinose dehydrogenase
VIQIKKDLAPKWKGDFLLATLRDQSLRRLKVFGNRVIIDERIPLNIRIRDLVAIEKFLYLLDDSGQIWRIDFESREKN